MYFGRVNGETCIWKFWNSFLAITMGWLGRLGDIPQSKRLLVPFLVRTPARVASLVSGWRTDKRQVITVFLSDQCFLLSPSPSLPLSWKISKIKLKKKKKKNLLLIKFCGSCNRFFLSESSTRRIMQEECMYSGMWRQAKRRICILSEWGHKDRIHIYLIGNKKVSCMWIYF